MLPRYHPYCWQKRLMKLCRYPTHLSWLPIRTTPKKHELYIARAPINNYRGLFGLIRSMCWFFENYKVSALAVHFRRVPSKSIEFFYPPHKTVCTLRDLRHQKALVVNKKFFKNHIFRTAQKLSIISNIKEFDTPFLYFRETYKRKLYWLQYKIRKLLKKEFLKKSPWIFIVELGPVLLKVPKRLFYKRREKRQKAILKIKKLLYIKKKNLKIIRKSKVS